MSINPGWYVPPNQPGVLRWWDGVQWTQFVQPLPVAPQPFPRQASPVSTQAQSVAQQGSLAVPVSKPQKPKAERKYEPIPVDPRFGGVIGPEVEKVFPFPLNHYFISWLATTSTVTISRREGPFWHYAFKEEIVLSKEENNLDGAVSVVPKLFTINFPENKKNRWCLCDQNI
jgi:hypothetical protein